MIKKYLIPLSILSLCSSFISAMETKASLENKVENAECAICLDDIKDKCPIILSCHQKHKFHALCIQDYAIARYKTLSKINCPLCRKQLDFSKVVD
jgi:hypothetical protein